MQAHPMLSITDTNDLQHLSFAHRRWGSMAVLAVASSSLVDSRVLVPDLAVRAVGNVGALVNLRLPVLAGRRQLVAVRLGKRRVDQKSGRGDGRCAGRRARTRDRARSCTWLPKTTSRDFAFPCLVSCKYSTVLKGFYADVCPGFALSRLCNTLLLEILS